MGIFNWFRKKKKEKAKEYRPEMRPAYDGARSYRSTASEPARHESHEDFGTSLAVGMVTDNALLGMLAGGSISGAFIGQAIADSNHESHHHHSEPSYTPDPTPSYTPDPTPSYDSGSDSGSSFDSSSSFDSNSCSDSSSSSFDSGGSCGGDSSW